MGFYQQLSAEYGHDIVNILKTWANNNIKLAHAKNRRIFLLNCRRVGVIPRHITHGCKCIYNLLDCSLNSSKHVENFNKNLSRKILSLEIKFNAVRIKELEKQLSQNRSKAEAVLPGDVIRKFKFYQVKSYNREFNTIKKSNCKKFNELYSRQVDELRTSDNWIKNLTRVTIPNTVEGVLSLGPKFGFPPRNVHVKMRRLLAEAEVIIKNTSSELQDLIRARTTNILTNYHFSNKNEGNFMSHLFEETRSFLRDNPDLVVMESDKGRVTVVMELSDYYERCKILLDDENVYGKLSSDPTNKIEKDNNKIIKCLKDNSYISESVSKSLKIYDSVAPRFYGLPKVHKEGVPMRPIVSTINAPTSKISKFIAEILKTSFSQYNEFSVLDSISFASKINDFKIPEGYKLVSLDAVSLFTNISLELTVEIIDDEWELILPHTDIIKEEFIHIIEFLFKSNYFVFNDEYYEQLFGCPMGSNLSPILANIVVNKLLKFTLPRLPFGVPFLYQFMDDILTAIPIDASQVTLDFFNDFDDHIKFTIEEENNGMVPFLDTAVVRDTTNILKLDWYQKPCSSGRYIHYKSYHDIKMKTNVILGMKRRIISIAHSEFRDLALKRLYHVFLANGYPATLLRKLIYGVPVPSVTDERESAQPTDQGEEIRYGTLPYIRGLTEELIKLFKDYSTVKIAKYNLVTNKVFFKNKKDKIPKFKQKDLIYKIKCKGCPMSYIGQTSQSLRRRLTLHQSDSRLRPERCALAKHVWNCDHQMDFDDVNILERESNYQKRLFLEMCHISLDPLTVNQKSDTDNLSNIYKFLLTLDKRG